MRPWVSVSGTRCTRCTPLSNFNSAKTPRALDLGDDFLEAAQVPSLTEIISTFQPCLAA